MAKTNISTVANEVEALARPFRAVIQMADLLKEYGGIENLTREIETQRDTAKKDAAKAVELRDAEQAKLAAAEQKVKAVEKAAAAATEIATTHGQSIRDTATADAKQITEDAQAKVAESKKETEHWNGELRKTKQAVATVQRELAALEQQQAALKKQFAQLAK